MKATVMLAGILLLSTFLSYGLDPPVKIWEKWYYTGYDSAYFEDIEITSAGNLFITARLFDYTQPFHEIYVALLLDQDGEVIWEVPHEFAGGSGYDGAVLPDGSFVITGVAVEDSTSNSVGLYIHRISSEGETIWARIYDYTDTKEEGYGITCLPDGGFAVCGRVHGTGTINAGQMWLLRTDANGDTLWTREWGSTVPNSPDWGKTVLFSNDELCVLAHGLTDSLPTYGPHLLFYDLDGNYLHGTDYPELYYIFPGDMCTASDSGFIFVTNTFPSISHTDQLGEIMWRHSIESSPNDENAGFCIRQTMDGGYLFSGWDGYFPGPLDEVLSESEYPFGNPSPENTVDYKEGWLVRFDADGNELWNFNNVVSHDNFFYSCVQLPQGGYITGGTWGGDGYLVRYSPETGIGEPEAASALRMNVSPNPFSSSLSVSFSLPEAMEATLTVFDLCGRVVGEVADDLYPQGISTIEWIPPDNLGSGCYLAMLNAADASVTRNCVLLR